jgi:N-acyl-D-amino-acid deacylase
MSRFDENAPALNLLTFTGHNTVRRQILGANVNRAATRDEIARMEELVEDAMRQGAFGLSSNLETGPGASSTLEELVALSRIVARYGGVFVVHLRNEGDKVVEAVLEAIQVGRQAKIPVHISHLKLGSAAMWDKAALVLAEIDKARRENIDVTADVFPYTTSDTVSMSEKDVRTLLGHASVMVASDAGLESPHPRGAGTFTRVLGPLARDEKVITLENAIRKMSGLPSTRLALRGRGTLARGSMADLVIFDPARVRDRSTFQDPSALSEGIQYVFVNGMMVIKDGQPTGARPGLALR